MSAASQLFHAANRFRRNRTVSLEAARFVDLAFRPGVRNRCRAVISSAEANPPRHGRLPRHGAGEGRAALNNTGEDFADIARMAEASGSTADFRATKGLLAGTGVRVPTLVTGPLQRVRVSENDHLRAYGHRQGNATSGGESDSSKRFGSYGGYSGTARTTSRLRAHQGAGWRDAPFLCRLYGRDDRGVSRVTVRHVRPPVRSFPLKGWLNAMVVHAAPPLGIPAACVGRLGSAPSIPRRITGHFLRMSAARRASVFRSNGLVRMCIPGSRSPPLRTALSAYPVINRTFRSGRPARAASAS